MIQSAKNEVFGHYLEFGQLDRLDIAYCESINAPAHFGNVTRPCRIIKRLQKCIWNDPNILKGGLRLFSQAWSVRLT